MENERIPDFFLIGPPKSATTTLSKWLEQSEEIAIPIKEPGYFSRDIFDTKISYENYLKIYKKCDQSKLFGDCSPKIIYSVNGVKEILDINKNAKFIIIERPLKDFILSYHYQLIKEGVQKIENINLAYRSNINNYNNLRLNYHYLLNRYQQYDAISSFFNEENCIILSVDALSSKGEIILSELCDFIGIEKYEIDFKSYNSMLTPRSAKLNRMITGLRRGIVDRMRKYFGVEITFRTGVMRMINAVNLKKSAVADYSSVIDSDLLSFIEDAQMRLDKSIAKLKVRKCL